MTEAPCPDPELQALLDDAPAETGAPHAFTGVSETQVAKAWRWGIGEVFNTVATGSPWPG